MHILYNSNYQLDEVDHKYLYLKEQLDRILKILRVQNEAIIVQFNRVLTYQRRRMERDPHNPNIDTLVDKLNQKVHSLSMRDVSLKRESVIQAKLKHIKKLSRKMKIPHQNYTNGAGSLTRTTKQV